MRKMNRQTITEISKLLMRKISNTYSNRSLIGDLKTNLKSLRIMSKTLRSLKNLTRRATKTN